MFKTGDYVMYGSTGVCEVLDVSLKDTPGDGGQCLCYTLKPMSQQCVITTPVDNRRIAMRPAISGEEAERLIDLIPSMKAQSFHAKAKSDLTEHYDAAIKTFNCEDLIAMTMSIYAKRQELTEKKKKMGAIDERFMRQAEDLLFGEMSVALGIPRNEVAGYIANRVAAMENAG